MEKTRSSHSPGSYEAKRQLLRQDPAFDRIFLAVQEDLRRIASSRRRQERYSTMGTTELVDELYAKLRKHAPPDLENQLQFKKISAFAIREILVDAARRRRARRRGGDLVRIPFDDAPERTMSWDETVLDIDSFLKELGEGQPRVAESVDLHFFGGCTADEIARRQGLAVATVRRDLRSGLAWLKMKVQAETPPPVRKSA